MAICEPKLRVSRTPRARGHDRAISVMRSHEPSSEPSSTKMTSMSQSAFSAIVRRRSASFGRLSALK